MIGGAVRGAVRADDDRPEIGEQVIGLRPPGVALVERPDQRGARALQQVRDQHIESAGRQLAAVQAEQVNAVVVKEIRLDLVAVLGEQEREAD
ncbi:hypothetical protein [Tsukamurella ocularis]|uniref:hypothetical protein n=1 Tax=Tsukamurella ocularis TaxID=1970234 RepID=UPI0039EED7C9